MNSKRHSIKIILLSILFCTSLFLLLLILWSTAYYQGLSLEEIVFYMIEPLKGADFQTLNDILYPCLIPVVVATLYFVIIMITTERSKYKIWFKIRFKKLKSLNIKIWPFPFQKALCLVLSLIFLTAAIYQGNKSFGLFGYFSSQIHTSTFIDDNYVDPNSVAINFPATKRNLIVIYLESMESTYSDIASGGAFPVSFIPELTKLGEENVNFSKTAKLGGATAVFGTQWTMAALFATNTGLPLNLPIDESAMANHSSFFPSVTGLGNILSNNGYHNVFFIGSDDTFGGRKLFFDEHGNYEECDYYDAINKGLIPPNYHVWWGYEDQKLFAFAKEKLTELSQNEQPFNFTMLTTDTHTPDGYVSSLCKNQFSEQYENVIACSSSQVYDFVNWIKQQPFYSNTTIVITGDHLTPNKTPCEDIPESERSVYNCFINAVPTISLDQTKNRSFSAMDLFPTILSSIGVQIEGDKLGLGVNLFSGKQTLLEKYGSDFSTDISEKSKFYISKMYGK